MGVIATCRNSDESAMASVLPDEVLDELVFAGSRRCLTLFVGAGISAAPPTNLPLARMMTDSIVGGICGQRPAGKKDPFWMAVDRLRPERLLSVLHEVMGDDAFTPLRLLGGAAPNRNHRMLAALADAGSLAAIITTNFDTAIEQALTDAAVPFTMLALEPDFAAWDGAPTPLALLKLHGSLPFGERGGGPLDALMEQVGRPLSPAKARALVRLIDTTHLVVAGYSGRDDFDIYPVLYEQRSAMDCTWLAHPTAPAKRRLHVGDEAAGLAFADFATLFAEPVTTDPVEGLLTTASDRVRRVEVDAGAALDELCWQLAHKSHPMPEQKPGSTQWQRDVAAWAEPLRGADVSRRVTERILAEGALRTGALVGRSDIDALHATLREQVQRGDVVNQGTTLLALGEACERAGQVEAAVEHFVACLAILSKTDQLGKVRMRTVVDTPQELSLPMARRAMGQLLRLLVSSDGWRFAERALSTLEGHFIAADLHRYLRSHLLSALESLEATEMNEPWLRWAIETISFLDDQVAIPVGVDPRDPAQRLDVAELMAEHILKVGMPIWQRLLGPLAAVDAARPRLALDFAAQWEVMTPPDRPLLPWFTALWLGRADSALEERLDRLEALARHPNNPGVHEAAAHSFRVLSREHGRSVLTRLSRLREHEDDLVRGSLTRALAEAAPSCRRESLALLKALRRDRSPHVRALAAQTLRRFRGPFWRRLLGLDH